MSITSDVIRGHTETIILAHLIEHDSYGYQINKEIMGKTGNTYELKEATLYSAFRRLEQAQLIISYWGNEEVGARRRYYAITDKGQQVYTELKKDWINAKEIIDRLLNIEPEQIDNQESEEAQKPVDNTNQVNNMEGN